MINIQHVNFFSENQWPITMKKYSVPTYNDRLSTSKKVIEKFLLPVKNKILKKYLRICTQFLLGIYI